jgi:hypothetical protein
VTSSLTHAAECATAGKTAPNTPVSDTVATTSRPGLTDLPNSGPLRRLTLAWSKRVACTWSDIALSGTKTVGSAVPKIALTRSRRVAGALPQTALTKPLLGLSHGRALIDVTRLGTIEAVSEVPIVIGHASAMSRIVHPVVAVADIYAIKMIAVDEVVVDDDIVAPPSAIPTPASPTSPTSTPDRSDRDTYAERDCARGNDRACGRIVYRWIGIVSWRSPYRFRIILWNVHDLGTRGLDLYVSVAALR